MNGSKKNGQTQEALINQEGFLAALLQPILQSILQEEFQKFIGARDYERTSTRKGLRNGYYERQLQTRIGSISLFVCRDRAGEFKTELFERYQRSEKALVMSMAEMVLQGVSTRKVSSIFEGLCGYSISKSQVSELTSKLDEDLKIWRERKLDKVYVYLTVDARYEKVRENGAVVSKAVVTIAGITEDGYREIIANDIINSESYEAWDSVFKKLIERGLHGVSFIVSDDNQGLRKALQKYFQNIKHQRCQVHFMRNFIHKLAKTEQAEGIKLLQEVFSADTKKEAMNRVQIVLDFLISRKKQAVADWLEENIEETLQVLTLPANHQKKMKSTNMIERVNQELKRRSRVIRIFPNSESCLRILSALCQEISESWSNKVYLTMK